MSKAFKERLLPVLPEVIQHYGTPFRIFDVQGIRDEARILKACFQDPIFGFQEYYAVKAWPNASVIARLMYQEQDFGFDCSSPSELISMREQKIPPTHLMLTSNNTSDELFELAAADGGCILNLDAEEMIDRVLKFPKLICFRYNPGKRRTGTGFIGNPYDSKYGVPHENIVEAYRRAIERGAKHVGIHTMIISNERRLRYMVQTVKMLLQVIEMVSEALNIKFEFFNIGGGIGIPYRPSEKPFNLPGLARESGKLLYKFKEKHGYAPRLFMECGRLMTGPHGALVARVIQRTKKYHKLIGVDTCTLAANPRPAVYPKTAYHHIDILDSDCRLKECKKGSQGVFNVHGSLCEDNDYFAKRRLLPKNTEVNDFMLQHDVGAHSPGMCSNYNGWLRIKELLLHPDGSVELIRRAETIEDLFATLEFEKDILKPSK